MTRKRSPGNVWRRMAGTVAILNLHLNLFLFFLAATVVSLSGCSSSRNNAASEAARQPNALITDFGEHRVPDSAFTIKVSERDGTLKVTRSRYYDQITVTNPATGSVSTPGPMKIEVANSRPGWKAQAGWFVYVENESRVWSYDGRKSLWLLLVKDPNGDANYECAYPCPIPPEVWSRLSEDCRFSIQKFHSSLPNQSLQRRTDADNFTAQKTLAHL